MQIHSTSLNNVSGICHGFFTREGGVSTGIYTSLNVGKGSDDNPDCVNENRSRVAKAMGGKLVTQHQVHSSHVVVIPAKAGILSEPIDEIPVFAGMTVEKTVSKTHEADAMVTNQPGLALGILTADCGPVLFADAQAGVIGAAHAGWKGAHGGVLENTVSAMEALGAQREQIICAIGPCIAQASYEVGAEFLARFDEQAQQRFFAPSPHPPPSKGEGVKHLFDLAGYITHRLRAHGMRTIESLGVDTYKDETRFFSYRRTTHRGESDYGRQISAIMLK